MKPDAVLGRLERLVRLEIAMDIYERLNRVARIKPGCFIGDGCSMHEIARDALIELAGKEAVIKELEKDVAFYKRYQTEKYAKANDA